MLGARGQWIVVSLQRGIMIQSWSISTGCNCCDEFSSVSKLVWPRDSTVLFLEPWCCKQVKLPEHHNPADPLTQLTTCFYSTESISAITPHCPACTAPCAADPTPTTPRAGLPCPPSPLAVPPPAVSHPRCPRSQRCRWTGCWNQTPSCSGWMGFSCALVFAAKKWCRHIKHPVLKDSSPSAASLEQICDYTPKLPYRELHVLSFYALPLKFILTLQSAKVI